MFTLPRGCIGLRKSSLWSQVLWTVLWCLNKHCSTTTLRLGRGTWAFDWVFRHIRPFNFFYTMVNTASIRSSPREHPPIRVDVVARWLSCALQRDSTHGFLQTLPLDRHRVTAGRETYPEATSMSLMLRSLWRGVLIRDFGFISRRFFARVSNLLFILLLLVFANVVLCAIDAEMTCCMVHFR